jgi:hypothetical protein
MVSQYAKYTTKFLLTGDTLSFCWVLLLCLPGFAVWVIEVMSAEGMQCQLPSLPVVTLFVSIQPE